MLFANNDVKRSRIALGRSLVLPFWRDHARCCVCGKDLPKHKMLHMTFSSRSHDADRKKFGTSLPAGYVLSVSDGKEYYTQLRDNAPWLQGLFIASSSDDWFAKHSEEKIRRYANSLVYATLYCPPENFLRSVIKAPSPQHRTQYRAYVRYVAQCKNYVIGHLPFRKTGRFFCPKCAQARLDQTIALVSEFQKQYPTVDALLADTHAKEHKLHIEAAGAEGERLADYELSWLPQEYHSMRLPDKKLLLSNPSFRNGEPQEYDHLLVSPYGVFSIETKNFGGKVTISPDGQWSQTKLDKSVGIPSPCNQADRHELLLRSFLPPEIPLFSIICISNHGVLIEGSENAPLPVVRYDSLRATIQGIAQKKGAVLAQQQVDDVITKISQHMNK